MNTTLIVVLSSLVVLFILGIVVFLVSKKNYLDSWDGTNDSARFRLGSLWWGYNKRTRSAFVINNGKPINFQVQTWKPRIAFWSKWNWNFKKADIKKEE